MTQEKKVIRVLKPTKKAKKFSPMLFGIIGTAFGVIATSVLLFTFLKNDTSSTKIQVQNNQQINSVPVATSEASTESSIAQTNTRNMEQPVEQATEAAIDDEHEGFNQPQPKLNEITQVFQHKKEPQVVAEPKSGVNPFDTFNLQPKPVTAATLSKPKPAIPEKTIPTRTNQPVQNMVKATVKPEPMTAKNSPKELQKTKAIEKEAEYEVPHATVQIAVTRSVKD